MTELAAALLGAIFGSLAGGLVQHRLWLRGTRRDVYARFLTAYDLAMDAARSYMGALKSLNEAHSGGDKQAPSLAMLELCEDCWNEWQTRRDVLRDLGSELELVASRWSQLQVMLLNMRMWDVSPAQREDDVHAAAQPSGRDLQFAGADAEALIAQTRAYDTLFRFKIDFVRRRALPMLKAGAHVEATALFTNLVANGVQNGIGRIAIVQPGAGQHSFRRAARNRGAPEVPEDVIDRPFGNNPRGRVFHTNNRDESRRTTVYGVIDNARMAEHSRFRVPRFFLALALVAIGAVVISFGSAWINPRAAWSLGWL